MRAGRIINEGFVYIYTLSDVNGNVFYVGATTNMELRLKGHLSEARFNHNNPAKNQIIRSLDYNIKITAIETYFVISKVTYHIHNECRKQEYEAIERYKALGHLLVNKNKPENPQPLYYDSLRFGNIHKRVIRKDITSTIIKQTA